MVKLNVRDIPLIPMEVVVYIEKTYDGNTSNRWSNGVVVYAKTENGSYVVKDHQQYDNFKWSF